MDLLSKATVCTGLIMSWLVFFHVYTMVKQKSSKGQNAPAIFVTLIGFGIFLLYGNSISNNVLIITNVNSIFCYIVYLFVVLKYKE